MRYSVRVRGNDGASVASSSADGDVVSVGTCQLKAFQVALKTMKEGEKVNLHIIPECTRSPFLICNVLSLYMTDGCKECCVGV